jgi:hypothetical protein
MEIRIQVIIDNDERTRRDIAHWDRPSLTSETLGLQLDEGGVYPNLPKVAVSCE